MKDKIKIGEYVRTVDGKIGIFDHYSNRKDGSLYKSHLDCFIKFAKLKYCKQCFRGYISKHSKNLIDLIEVGDFVNGYKIDDKKSTLLGTQTYRIDKSGCFVPISQYGEGIKTILTHEQYEENCYKVVE